MKKTKNEQTEVVTAPNTDKPTIAELMRALQEENKDVTIHILPNGEATIEPQAPSVDPPVDSQADILPEHPAEMTDEGIAQLAYAKVAEELKFKGDFPAWDQISDRARGLYFEGAAHVQNGGAPRTRYEEIVEKMLPPPDTEVENG